MVFWRRRQPQPPVVSCYGKLPATGDFIRLNAHGAENHAFDTWLGNSIAHAKQALGEQFKTAFAPTLGLFIYRGDDGDGSDEPERGMIGVWAASGDSAGRSYPMLVSTSYDYEEMLAVGPALPIAVWPFLTTAYDLVANGRSLQPSEFTQRVAMIQPMRIEHAQSVSAAYTDWLKNQRMGALWETTFGSVEQRYHVVQSVQAAIEIFRGQERPQTTLALRLPIGAGDAYAAAVWMDMTLRLAQWERTVLNAFWTPQHDLLLHVGPPHSGTFRELISNSDAEHVCDLLRPPTVDAAAARQSLGPIAELVDDVNQTIYAFLYGLKPPA